MLEAQRLIEEPLRNGVPRLAIADSGRRGKAVVRGDSRNCGPLEHEIEKRLEVRDRQHVGVGAHEHIRVGRRRPVQLVDLAVVVPVGRPLAGKDHGDVREVGEPAGELEGGLQPRAATEADDDVRLPPRPRQASKCELESRDLREESRRRARGNEERHLPRPCHRRCRSRCTPRFRPPVT